MLAPPPPRRGRWNTSNGQRPAGAGVKLVGLSSFHVMPHVPHVASDRLPFGAIGRTGQLFGILARTLFFAVISSSLLGALAVVRDFLLRSSVARGGVERCRGPILRDGGSDHGRHGREALAEFVRSSA